MKKIMFNDRYELTKAVLEGRKKMTRRIITNIRPYRINEEVAVAMSYKTIIELAETSGEIESFLVKKGLMSVYGHINGKIVSSPGWRNKMYVSAELMPYHIRMNYIKAEWLQDISEEDCLKEGIYTRPVLRTMNVKGYVYTFDNWSYRGVAIGSDTAKGAFSSLIDRINGKGTWERNPWVFAYEFELIK